MNILLVTNLYPSSEQQSNYEVSYAIHDFVKKWRDFGHNVKIIKLMPETNFRKLSNEFVSDVNGIEIFIKPFRKLKGFNLSSPTFKKISDSIINNFCGEFIPDVVISHKAIPNLSIAKHLKFKFNCPLVHVFHKSDFQNLKKKYIYRKSILKNLEHIDRIGFRSPKLQEKFYSVKEFRKHVNDLPSFVIPSGVEKEIVISNKQFIELKATREITTLFVASRLVKQKRIEVIIEGIYKTNNPSLKLRIAGDGPEKNKLIKQVKSLNLEQQVEFLGGVTKKQVLKEMESADVFVLLSTGETFGLVYIEAMAKSNIVIGTKGEGIDGTIIDGENGYLIPSIPEKLTEILQQIINMNKSQKKNLMKNAVNTAEENSLLRLSQHYLRNLEHAVKNN